MDCNDAWHDATQANVAVMSPRSSANAQLGRYAYCNLFKVFRTVIAKRVRAEIRLWGGPPHIYGIHRIYGIVEIEKENRKLLVIICKTAWDDGREFRVV